MIRESILMKILGYIMALSTSLSSYSRLTSMIQSSVFPDSETGTPSKSTGFHEAIS